MHKLSKDEKALLAQANSELRKLDKYVTLTLTPLQAWVTMCMLQVVLRHPTITGPTAATAENVARKLQRLVAKEGALCELAEAGWEFTKRGKKAKPFGGKKENE